MKWDTPSAGMFTNADFSTDGSSHNINKMSGSCLNPNRMDLTTPLNSNACQIYFGAKFIILDGLLAAPERTILTSRSLYSASVLNLALHFTRHQSLYGPTRSTDRLCSPVNLLSSHSQSDFEVAFYD